MRLFLTGPLADLRGAGGTRGQAGGQAGVWVAADPGLLAEVRFCAGLLRYGLHDLDGGALACLPGPDSLTGPAPVLHAALTEALAQRALRSDDEIRRRFGHLLTRAQAALNARIPAPATLRHAAGPGDVAVQARRIPYANYFSVEEYDLTHRRFDGTTSAQVTRAVFISGDAVVVLPWDPVRDLVLLTEQFRAGPLGRGDPQCWSLEAVAGRIDGGETPEQAARREAQEEAGLTLGPLIALGGQYPSPGAKAEYLHLFAAPCDLSQVAATGGLESEDEDIRLHVLPWDRMMALIDTGEINNGPLVALALLLARRRAAGLDARAALD